MSSFAALFLHHATTKSSLATLLALAAVFSGCSSTFISAPSHTVAANSYSYPLKVSPNGHYLVDQNNKPFRIQGDSAQSLIANATYSEAEQYLSDRQAKGFNTININLIEHRFAVHAPADRNGDQPFFRPADFSAPNDAYFAYADSIIDLAASKGLLVSFAAMYMGYGGRQEGWWKVLNNPVNTQSVCFEFGRYVGNHYKDRKNIFWVIGGDYSPPAGSEGEARLLKYMQGIKAAGATQPWAADWSPDTNSTDQLAFAPFLDLNAVYAYDDGKHPGLVHVQASRAYTYMPSKPAYLKETGYEDEHESDGEPAFVRKYQYDAFLGGATAGVFFGNRDVWGFATKDWWSGFAFGHAPWQTRLNSPGAYDMVRLGNLLDSIPWFDLIPRNALPARKLVVQGGGNFSAGDYISAAITSDGKALLAYIPPTSKPSTPFTVDLAALAGLPIARWFDPSSGKYTDISLGSLPRRGTAATFTAPGRNATSTTDLVLVLKADGPGG
jgi:hypothetical protein